MAKIKNWLIKYWFKLFLILLFLVLFISLKVINDKVDAQKNELLKINTRLSFLEIDTNSGGFIDPYGKGFQTINDSLSISVDDIKEYGSGSKISFEILNKDSVAYENLNFTIKAKGPALKIVDSSDYKIIEMLPSGSSKGGEIIFSNAKPDQIKTLSVSVGDYNIRYNKL